MKKIRNYRSCLSKQQCMSYKKSSLVIQPVNSPICRNFSIYEVSDIGNKRMKKDEFVLSKGVSNV